MIQAVGQERRAAEEKRIVILTDCPLLLFDCF